MSTEGDRVAGRHPTSGGVAGIVLAAGESRRMGAAKPLLDDGGEPLLLRLVEALRAGGCDPVLVVAGGGEGSEVERIAGSAGARLVRNDDPASEQIDSLRLAVRALDPGTQAAVITPADRPGLVASTVAHLLEAYERTGAALVVPTWLGERGHPTLFARALFADLESDDLPDGARTVIARHADNAVQVEVADPGVPVDLDTPEDVVRWRERRGHGTD